jgi:regulator of sigma E protease
MSALYIILAILIFGFLIFIHELGHFLTAKLCGVRVNEFAINMGPKLFGWKRGETQYSFRLIPIGGYCAMEGEDQDTGDSRCFVNAAWWKRLIILCAGSFMNLLTGYLVICLLLAFAYPGTSTAEITAFAPGNVMESQGLKVGDTLYAINGRRIYQFSDFSLLETRLNTEHCELTVLRDGEKVVFEDFSLTRAVEVTDAEGNTQKMLGLSFGKRADKDFGSILRYGVYECIDFTRMVWYGLTDLFTGKAGLKDMGGVVGVVDVMVQSGESAKTVAAGIVNVLYLGAFIAVNLAVMNMLPIPALDGGRVLFLLIGTVYTGITKKKINPKYEGYIHAAAMVLLLGLMAVLLVKDVLMIVNR